MAFSTSPPLVIDIPQFQFRRGVVGHQGNGFLGGSHGLFGIADLEIGLGQPAVSLGVARLNLDGGLQVRHRRLAFTL